MIFEPSVLLVCVGFNFNEDAGFKRIGRRVDDVYPGRVVVFLAVATDLAGVRGGREIVETF